MTFRTRPRLLLATCAGAAAAIFSLCIAAPAARADHIEKRFNVKSHPVVILHNPNGSVSIHSWSKPVVQVLADHSSQQVSVDLAQKDNVVEVVTRLLAENVTPQEMRADYDITVPEETELQIHDDAGSVQVVKVLGDTNVETATAGVVLQDMGGFLIVKTIGGSVECTRCDGRIDIASFSGSLRLLQGQSAHVSANTTRGNILFDGQFIPNGRYNLSNYSGVIEVLFSPEDSLRVHATSLHGSVTNEAKLILSEQPHTPRGMPRFGSGFTGDLNQGKAHLDLSSFDGTIHIRQRQ
jgi:DUF4097 and DUF4098 domain-containing protein YvlB